MNYSVFLVFLVFASLQALDIFSFFSFRFRNTMIILRCSNVFHLWDNAA